MRFKLFGRGPEAQKGGLNEASVSPHGEVITRAFDYSEPTINQLTDTTVTNFIKPLTDQQFILTGMYASADRSINANGDVLEIYESSTADSGTQDKLLFSVDLARQGNSGPIFPTTKITEGKFINADRTNATGTITVTLWGYFIPTAS